MERKYGIEIVRHVYDTDSGTCVEVGPDAEGGSHVEIRTLGKNADYWGEIRLTLPPEMAMELGRALIAAANDFKP